MCGDGWAGGELTKYRSLWGDEELAAKAGAGNGDNEEEKDAEEESWEEDWWSLKLHLEVSGVVSGAP